MSGVPNPTPVLGRKGSTDLNVDTVRQKATAAATPIQKNNDEIVSRLRDIPPIHVILRQANYTMSLALEQIKVAAKGQFPLDLLSAMSRKLLGGSLTLTKMKRNKLTTCVKPARLWLPFGLVLAMASSGAFAASVITPVSAVANQEHTAANSWGLASNLIDASAINGSNQLVARGWNNNYLSNEWGTWEQWVVVDLGADYDLAEINVWNYHDSDTANNLVGRSTSGSSLWVGGSGATLPTVMTPVGLNVAGSTSTDINGNNPFNAGTGWTSVWSGDLLNHTMDGLARDADLTVDASAQTGVRYVGFNIDDRYGHYNYDLSGAGLGNQVEDPAYPTPWSSFEVGLGYIQVTQIPEPSTPLLLGLATLGLAFFRRRK